MSSRKCKLKRDTIIHLFEWPKSRSLTTSNADEDVEQQKLLFIAGGNAKCYCHFARVWWFLTKLNILVTYNTAIMLFGVYLKELKTYVHTKNCTQVFITVLFITAKTCKQPRCPSVGEWIINKLWPVQTMEYY